MPRIRPQYYRLIGRLAVPCGLGEFARQYGSADARRVAVDIIGPLRISTVFLGLDHRYIGPGDPLLFETMIFDGSEDHQQMRCSTWDQAEEQHRRAVEVARVCVETAEADLQAFRAIWQDTQAE